MKKVYLKSYFNKNIGDDIFIKIILERYPKVKFILYGDKNYFEHKNLIFKKRNLFIRIINKILNIISKRKFNYETILSNACDATVILGGSMFIEKEMNPYQCLNAKNLYILGINFGPYQKKEYYDYCYDLFAKSKDVCFRDKKSYMQFKELNNVRHSVDMVLLSNLDKKYSKRKIKKVIFSLINCENKFPKPICDKYYTFIKTLVIKFKKMGYKIGMISFCEGEYDSAAIRKIKLELKNESIDEFIYDGNLDAALEYINDSEIIVGTRFHANILGIIFDKTIIPIAYSDKTIDELQDLGYKNEIFDIRQINQWNINKINSEYLEYKISNKYKNKSLDEYFKNLDKILLGGKNDE